MKEWRQIPGFANYSASSDGEIRRDVRLHNSPRGLVSQALNDRGYWKCSVTDDNGKSRTVTVHTLVALAFLGPSPGGLWICHKDGMNENSRASNLRYDTPASNTADLRAHGRMRVGSAVCQAKLREEDIPQILELWRGGTLTQEQIGQQFGVSQRAIWQVIHRKKWAHVERRVGQSARSAQ